MDLRLGQNVDVRICFSERLVCQKDDLLRQQRCTELLRWILLWHANCLCKLLVDFWSRIKINLLRLG